MSCPIPIRQPETLLDFCAGRLTPAESRRFEEHLATCAECRRETAAQKAVWAALDDWDDVPLSPGFNRRLYTAIEEIDHRRGLPGWPRAWSWKPVLPLAAACATLAVALFVQRPAPPPDTQVKLDVEQVEQALDDVDLIRQLSDDSPPPPAM